jgi:hypothetical protein
MAVVLLYLRAMPKIIEAAVRSAIESTRQGFDASNIAELQCFPGAPGGKCSTLRETVTSDATVLSENSRTERGTFRSMSLHVETSLDGPRALVDADVAGASSEALALLAWPFRASRDARDVAEQLGVELLPTELPAESEAQILVGAVLMYRDDDDADKWIRFGLAAVVLERAGVVATEADTWQLAAHLARPAPPPRSGLLGGCQGRECDHQA